MSDADSTLKKMGEAVRIQGLKNRVDDLSRELGQLSGRSHTWDDRERKHAEELEREIRESQKEIEEAERRLRLGIKLVYAQVGKNSDVLIITDGHGGQVELTGPETEAAKLKPGGTDALYRSKLLPVFCPAGEPLEVLGVPSNVVIWKS